MSKYQVNFGASNEVVVSDTEPTNPNVEIWIDPTSGGDAWAQWDARYLRAYEPYTWVDNSAALRSNNSGIFDSDDEIFFKWRNIGNIVDFVLRFKIIGTPVAGSVNSLNYNGSGMPWSSVVSMGTGMSDSSGSLKPLTCWTSPFTWLYLRQTNASGLLENVTLAQNTVVYLKGTIWYQ